MLKDPEPESTVSETYNIVRDVVLVRAAYVRSKILFNVTVFLILAVASCC